MKKKSLMRRYNVHEMVGRADSGDFPVVQKAGRAICRNSLHGENYFSNHLKEKGKMKNI